MKKRDKQFTICQVDPLPPPISALITAGKVQPGTRMFVMGNCRIFVSPPHPNGHSGWHMSISRADRLPSWEEVKHARYALIPNEIVMVMFLPPIEEYVNIHPLTFHLHELHKAEDEGTKPAHVATAET